MVLFPDNFKVSKSFRNILNRNTFQVSYNTAFSEVIKACALVPRLGQEGEWLTQDMQDAYIQMHELGWAHSVEVWQNNELVGGLYGIGFKGIFFGESMFSKVSNASKVALHNLCLRSHPLELKLIDCQVYTDHLASLGAEEIDRSIFKTYLPGLNPQKLKL
jgi:leucyl/phenylalanyl-tRNA--protein transferase